MKKLISILSVVAFQVSSVAGEGYRGAVNRTLNPESMEQVRVLYETLGRRVAAILAVPLLGMFVYGALLSEWERENYWLILVLGFVLAVVIVIAFPFGLKML